MLLVFRIGANIPIPGIDKNVLSTVFQDNDGLFDIFNLFSGGAFQKFTIFTLGVSPFITSSIIVQLLTMGFEKFRAISEEIDGKKRLERISLFIGLGIAIAEAIGVTFGIFRRAIMDNSMLSVIAIITTLTAGALFLHFIGDQITVRGLGNGISMLILAGIIARIPTDIAEMIVKARNGVSGLSWVIGVMFIVILLLVLTVYVQGGEKRISTLYAKKVIGRKSYGGNRSYIPLKVNQAGVIPVIFALAVIGLPATVSMFIPNSSYANLVRKWFSSYEVPGIFIYALASIVLITIFTFIYTRVTFDPIKISDDLRKNGGVLPGIRQGKATSLKLEEHSSKMMKLGALFLSIISVIPMFLGYISGIDIAIGGTSMIILVGAIMEVINQIDLHLILKNRKGIL